MEKIIKPHSEEWFEELENQNSIQAAQTRQIISLAGSTDVCSICGDEESSDYKLESNQSVSGMVVTLRLCNDCRNKKNNAWREVFST